MEDEERKEANKGQVSVKLKRDGEEEEVTRKH